MPAVKNGWESLFPLAKLYNRSPTPIYYSALFSCISILDIIYQYEHYLYAL